MPDGVAALLSLLILSTTGFGAAWIRARTALRELRRVRQQETDLGLHERLESMEQTMHALRAQVQRVEEGQSFTTDVLSRRNADLTALPRSTPAVPGPRA